MNLLQISIFTNPVPLEIYFRKFNFFRWIHIEVMCLMMEKVCVDRSHSVVFTCANYRGMRRLTYHRTSRQPEVCQYERNHARTRVRCINNDLYSYSGDPSLFPSSGLFHATKKTCRTASVC